MKIIINILIGIAVLIAILLIAALFVKKTYTVSKEITVNKPRTEVFSYIRMMKNQNEYNKWWMMDPAKKMDYKGTDGTIGFTAYWDSQEKSVGKGEQEIKSIQEDQRIDYEVRFIRPFENTASIYFTLDSLGPQQTKVTWVFAGANKYPMNLMNLFLGGILGKDLQSSIENLKTAVEK